MKQRIHDALLSLIGVAGIAFFALSGASCETPTMQCAVGHGPYFVKYTKTSGDDACYNKSLLGTGGPTDAITGEEVGFSTYLTPMGRTEVKDDMGKVIAVDSDGADYNTRNIAIQSTVMGANYRALVPFNAAPPDGSGSPYAFGPYASKPDAGDICYAGGINGTAALAAAEVNLPDDMLHWRQTWSDIELFVTTNIPGTQVAGKMKFEDVIAGCSADYTFFGMYPAVPCGDDVFGQVDNDMDAATPVENDTDDDGDPMTPVDNDKDDDEDPMTPVTDDDGMPGPDVDADEEEYIRTDPNDIYCDPKGDPSVGRLGSGINPDFVTKCDTVDFYCLVTPETRKIQ